MLVSSSLRIGIAVVAVITLGLRPWNERAGETLGTTALATSSFRTQSDADLTQWALNRFERAGLHLPPLSVAFHDDKQPCDGHLGVFRAGTPAHIDVCGFNWDRFLVTPKRTILHEMGHAWAHHNLTEGVHQRFLKFRGLATWGDDQTPWEERGIEQAAEIIAWALIDEEHLMLTIGDTDPQTLADAYEVLTSSHAPPWGRTTVTAHGVDTP